MNILVPISIGELYDKISILIIKKEKITDVIKLENIQKELNFLWDVAEDYQIDGEFHTKLHEINYKLWDIEDRLRIKEKKKQYDDEFRELARQVYITNDKRSDVKKAINLKYGSDIIEEKSYEKY